MSVVDEQQLQIATLPDLWELRSAAAATLIIVERQLKRHLSTADTAQLVTMLDMFSPARSPGPEWTRSFIGLMEHLWTWCDEPTLAEAEAEYRARGPAWAAVANALRPENGAEIRARLSRGPVQARLPAFTIG